MMLPIDFDDEPMFMNNKVREIRTDGRLLSNMHAIPATKLPQLGPKFSFAIRHCSPQLPRPV